MKKSKLSIGLVTSFVAALALSACSVTVTKNDTNLVDFKGYGDEELAVLIDEVYSDYMQSSSGISKYYEKVMEILIRNAFAKDPKGESTLAGIKKNYNQIENEAKDNVKGAKQTAKDNASTNGTTYKTEWQSVLKEKGVEDEQELLQYYIYQLEKEEIEDWYYEQHKDALKAEYLGVDKQGDPVATVAKSRFPYHVRHILVKVEDGGSDYVRGTITKDQAKLLSNTVELLAQGVMSFGEVAQKKSEDSSASSYGDVGIMSNAISSGKLGMVNEFQLGIYAYDAIKKNGTKNEDVDVGLGLLSVVDTEPGTQEGEVINVTAKDYFKDRGIVEVPYSVFKELGDVAELENNYETGYQVEDGKSALYPRNLLWNRYLNNHSIFVITNGSRQDTSDVTAAMDIDPKSAEAYYTEIDPYTTYKGEVGTIDYRKLTRLQEVDGFDGASERVLVDENQNVIIGVRSEFGIHLMIVQKSAYDYDGEVSLDEYYTTAIPGDADYPTTQDGQPKTTYVNFISSVNKSEYNTRAETVKNAIKGFDSTYDYRLYEDLSLRGKEDRVNKFGEDTIELFNSIDDYIELQREKNRNSQDEGLEQVWKTYIELLEAQDWARHETERIVPEGCKIAFSDKDYDKAWYEEGGKCYVK